MSLRLPLGPLAGPLGRDLRSRALRDAADHGDAGGNGSAEIDERVVAAVDLAGLPEPAQRYLRFMGVVGRPRDRSFLVRLTGRFRRPGGSWMPCDAWQFNTNHPVLRVFHMRLDLAGVIPMVGRDSYVAGRGEMRGKLLGLVTVADGSGPELDLGELVTYLNDAAILAPSMLLDDSITWEAVDDESFTVRLTDRGNTVAARISVAPDGSMRDFATDDRWYDGPDGLLRARWTTPIDGWTDVDGRPWMTGARAIWQLPDGPLPYVEARFVAGSIVRNRPAGDLLGRRHEAARS